MISEEVKAKIKAQREYCDKTKNPNFAKFYTNNGVCPRCRKQIYDAISLEKASSELITGCPHCHKTYCD